jgi:chromosome partitioning protein
MRVVAIVNQKGGCGKTTTAVNLAAVLARDGARTLLVDMDPQSHCAAGLGVPEQTLERTVADAILADHAASPAADDYLWDVARNLRLLPSSVSLAALEAPSGPLASRLDRDRRLARVLAAWRGGFDWCVVDCPPTIGLLTFNALRAADLVLVPVETGYFSLKGAERQIETIQAVVRRFGRDIPFRLLPTLVNESRALSRDVVATLRRRFPDALLPISVREHDELRDAASYGQAITEFAPESEAARDFDALARWLREEVLAGRALDEYGGLPAAARVEVGSDAFREPPVIETLAARPDLSARPEPAERSAFVADSIMARGGAAPQTDRASDLAARLRALPDRARTTAPAGGGFGVRAGRDGIVVFTQPSSPRAMSVVGAFNGWHPDALPFRATADGARLEAQVALSPGRHAYRIVVDGVETLDEFNLHRTAQRGELGVNLVEVPAPAATASDHRTALHASEYRR